MKIRWNPSESVFGRHSRQRWRADWISSAIVAVERAEKGQDEIIEGEGREGDRVRILRWDETNGGDYNIAIVCYQHIYLLCIHPVSRLVLKYGYDCCCWKRLNSHHHWDYIYTYYTYRSTALIIFRLHYILTPLVRNTTKDIVHTSLHYDLLAMQVLWSAVLQPTC